MNPLNLLWIVPVSFSAGFAAGILYAAIAMQAQAYDDWDEEKEYSGLLTDDE